MSDGSVRVFVCVLLVMPSHCAPRLSTDSLTQQLICVDGISGFHLNKALHSQQHAP